MNIAEIGRRIRAARLAQGLTQAQVADRAGISRTTFTRLELGSLPEIGLTKLQNVLAVVDMTAEIRAMTPEPTSPKRSLPQVIEARRNDPQGDARVREQLQRFRRSLLPGTSTLTAKAAIPTARSAKGPTRPTLDELLEQRANDRRDRTTAVRNS